MTETNGAVEVTPLRRRVLMGVAVALGSVAGLRVSGQMKEVPAKPGNETRTSLQEKTDFKVSAQRIYDALTDSKQFAAFSGAPAQIDATPGGAFSLFGGQIEGRNLDLIPGKRLVQAWRPADWAAKGLYTVVKFELEAHGSETTLVIDQWGFPPGGYDHLSEGWQSHYIAGLRKYFSA